MARKNKTDQVHLALEPKRLAEWKAEADRLGISLNSWIQLRVDGYLSPAKAT